MSRKSALFTMVLATILIMILTPVITDAASKIRQRQVKVTDKMEYSQFSAIKDGSATLYECRGPEALGITVCVDAGHGTEGGSDVRTLCHPDGTPKITGGTTAAGETTAPAVSPGMTFPDGTLEAAVNLRMAMALKNVLLVKGYNVLMVRETPDARLDNIARAVLANSYAQCHISLHWDSTETDKGAFYCKTPDNAAYKAMEPVASVWEESDHLGECLIGGLRDAGVKIFSSGSIALDLTQTSYSKVPTADIELGDKASSHTDAELGALARALADGIDEYFADAEE